jgi:flagellar motor switch protein FliM
MKQDFAFVAQRALARHSAVLLRPGPADADLIEALRQAGARLARTLGGALARLCGGDVPAVAIAGPQTMAMAEFAAPGLNAYSLYSAAPSGERVLSAIAVDAVLRLVDRAFGGSGEAPHPLPRELPLSADLMVQRIETLLANQLGLALGGAGSNRPVIHPLRRDTDLAQLQPFAPTAALAVIEIAVTEGLRAPWHIRLALPLTALPLLTGLAMPPAPPRPGAEPGDPASAPFAAMPLRLTALLVDAKLPLQTVSRLAPGQVLNLPIARQVPLIAGQHTIGHGTIGAVDGSVAIQVTRLS